MVNVFSYLIGCVFVPDKSSQEKMYISNYLANCTWNYWTYPWTHFREEELGCNAHLGLLLYFFS